MKPTFPHRYTSSITRVGLGVASVEAAPRSPITGGPPPEFHGDAHAWSPEHLLVGALGLCLFTTFESFARRDNLEVLGWRDVVTGTLDRSSSGLAFTGFEVEVEITVLPHDRERARTVLDQAKRSCIISRALHAHVTVNAHIWSHDERAHSSVA
jgi:organic hydroperoxide reductase OsmC/OhrA